MIAVDSPPGRISPSSPSSCSGSRTSTGSAPRRRSTATCSRKFPCTARTPIRSDRSTTQSLEALFGLEAAPPASDGDAERDEQEAEEREDERRHEAARPARGVRDAGEEGDPGSRPLDCEMTGREHEAERAEHRPARTRACVREADVDEPHHRDERPLEVARMPPVEEAAADQHARSKLEPERRRTLGGAAGGEVGEPDGEGHDRRPAAAPRDEIGEEEPADDDADRGEERESETAQVVDDGRE